MILYYFIIVFSSICCETTALRYQQWYNPHASSPRLYKRNSGYQPQGGSCEPGNTCSEACGSGFEQCPAVTENVMFCYNSGAGQLCCENGQGFACDKGYYCAEDGNKKTWCCVEDLDLAACASSHGLPGLYSALPEKQSTSPSAQTATVTEVRTQMITLQTTLTAAPNATAPFTSTSMRYWNATATNSSSPVQFIGSGIFSYQRVTLPLACIYLVVQISVLWL